MPDSFTYTLAGGNTVTVSLTINGLDTDDLLLGTAGVDILIAGAGADTLFGFASSDDMDGGTGIDKAVLSGAATTFTDLAIGWLVQSSEGNDLLRNVEILVEGSGQRNLLVGSTGFATSRRRSTRRRTATMSGSRRAATAGLRAMTMPV